MATQKFYVSLLVRLWFDENPISSETTTWQGEIEHIQSGQHWHFDSLEEILNFMQFKLRDSALIQYWDDDSTKNEI